MDLEDKLDQLHFDLLHLESSKEYFETDKDDFMKNLDGPDEETIETCKEKEKTPPQPQVCQDHHFLSTWARL